MSGIGIITNPHSKLNKRNPHRPALLGYILGEQGRLEITNSLDDLTRVAREFRDKGIHNLAINGGDGTICRTLTAFIREYDGQPLPKVTLLRGGTINVLANNLKIRGTPEQILFRLLENYSAGENLKTRRLRTLEVDGNYGFLFGNGVAASFLKEYYKHKSGPVGALLWAMRVWLSRFYRGALYQNVIRDAKQTLTPQNMPPISHTSCAVFCSTIEKLPLGYPLFTRLRDDTADFQCVSFTFAAQDAIWQLPVTMIKKQDGSSTGKLSFSTKELVIEMEAPFDFTLDGELYESHSEKLKIGMGPDIEFIII